VGDVGQLIDIPPGIQFQEGGHSLAVDGLGYIVQDGGQSLIEHPGLGLAQGIGAGLLLAQQQKIGHDGKGNAAVITGDYPAGVELPGA